MPTLHCIGPAPLTRHLPAAASSRLHLVATRRFLVSQSPASSKGSVDENLRRVLHSKIEFVVQLEESTADKDSLLPQHLLQPSVRSICFFRHFSSVLYLGD
jgi:hypothetical protein